MEVFELLLFSHYFYVKSKVEVFVSIFERFIETNVSIIKETSASRTREKSSVTAMRFRLIFQSCVDSPDDSWTTVPQPVWNMWFAEFLKYFCWDSQLNTEARDGFDATAVKRYRRLMHNLRIASKKPAWIPQDVYDGLLAKWDDPEYKAKCEQA
ncbi:hypothetical protein M9H77_16973 [Catharanthus roseus]|uniref:Uncharacterized protein n=1 Tax=Catharanthus roseus TaxID=4058 RepID=A0ACC0B388_CATRO|nr:hypothetical protein M9H77_16973 [Catharanthus roseus]